MPDVAPCPSLFDAYHRLVTTLPAEHLHLVADVLTALQHATLKEMNALVTETAQPIRQEPAE
jgi:hypothetical protein